MKNEYRSMLAPMKTMEEATQEMEFFRNNLLVFYVSDEWGLVCISDVKTFREKGLIEKYKGYTLLIADDIIGRKIPTE